MDPNKIRNERGEITANITEIKNTVRKYYEHVYANKVDNVEEMFLEAYGLLKLNLEETDNLNRPITRSERGSVKEKSRTRWLYWGILPNI